MVRCELKDSMAEGRVEGHSMRHVCTRGKTSRVSCGTRLRRTTYGVDGELDEVLELAGRLQGAVEPREVGQVLILGMCVFMLIGMRWGRGSGLVDCISQTATTTECTCGMRC